jgi:opacity protein-like surface antigen
MKFRWLPVMVVVAVAALAATPVVAQEGGGGFRFGVQGNYADDADFGVGARAQFGLDSVQEGLGLVGSFDYYFPGADDDSELGVDVDVTYWEINANLVYTLTKSGSLAPYVGAGLNVAHAGASAESGGVEVSVDETELGANLLGGVRFSDRFFAEAKIELSGGEMFVITGGILF